MPTNVQAMVAAGTDAPRDPQVRPRRRVQTRSIATRLAFLAAGRELFTREGYHATGTHDLVAQTTLTRGALYHHFWNKEELFEAVFRDVASDLYRSATDTVLPLSGDPWRQLILGLTANLHFVASSREIQQILLIDGPAVLGWRRWRDLYSDAAFRGTAETLAMLIDRGIIEDRPTEPMAHLIVAALNDAALSIANADDRHTVQVEMTDALVTLIKGLRSNAESADRDCAIAR